MLSIFCILKFLSDPALLKIRPPHRFFAVVIQILKGLGYAILGNFSTDQIVIELTKI